MKTISKLVSIGLLSTLAFGALATGGTVTPSDCGVSSVNDPVSLLVSKVPGRSFIACRQPNYQHIVVKNQTITIFEMSNGNGDVPSAPWTTNPDGQQSFVCHGPLSVCGVMYE